MKIEEIAEIINILKQTDVTEFEIDQDGTHIKLTRGKHFAVPAATINGVSAPHLEPAIVGAVPNGHVAAAPVAQAGQAASIPSHFVKVESPIVGTFYRKPSPDADPFVQEGVAVKKGDTLCIVEAMKLMNEIESPCSGKIEKVLLTDGEVVEFGEVLFYINPQA
ncbi:MAG: acetyl-CoA carboxylase biotin carboxyl carrier protein [Oligoflexia bacterium]|nr:acetyl-CoA carboxylase biotin carboxyl carrier protein [Oligoflexia bacterium]